MQLSSIVTTPPLPLPGAPGRAPGWPPGGGGEPPSQELVPLKPRNLRCIWQFFPKNVPKTSSESVNFQIWAILGCLKLEFWLQVSAFFEREHLKLLEKHHFSPIWPSNSSKKKRFFLCKIRGFSFSANPKTSCFTVFQALFPCKNAAKCSQTLFFHFGKAAKHEVWGSPKGLQEA